MVEAAVEYSLQQFSVWALKEMRVMPAPLVDAGAGQVRPLGGIVVCCLLLRAPAPGLRLRGRFATMASAFVR
jgi:hypothetical protein